MEYHETFLLYAVVLAVIVAIVLAIPARFDPAMRIKAKQSGVSLTARPSRGAVVVAFDCRGCMADDHRFMWIGTVTGYSPNANAGESVVVKINKSDKAHGDSRDRDLGTERPVWDNGAFQKLAPNLYALYS